MNDFHLTLLTLVLRVTVVLAVFGALAALLPRASAALRHTVWTLGLTAALAVPAVWSLAPALTWIPRVPTQADVTTPPVTAPPPSVSVTTPEPAIALASPGDSTSSVPRTVTVEPVTTAEAWPGLLARHVPHIWLAGTALMLLPVVLGTFRLALLRRRSPLTTDISLLAAHQAAATRLGLSKPPPLRTLDRPTMPLCFGFWRPVVLLPNEAVTWEPDRLRSVLLHELAHIQRQDLRTQLLTTLARAVYWFHPLAWIAHHQTVRLREQACDDQVLSAGQSPDGYARHLLDIASRTPSPPALHAAGIAMARASTLETRMRAILDTARNRHHLSGAAWGILVASALLVTGLIGTSGVVRHASAQVAAPAVDYASMTSDQLIDAVIAADARLRSATESWTNLHVRLRSEDQKQNAAGDWEPWGPRTDLRFWVSDRSAQRFRVDFMPQIVPWFGGPQPFSETRLSLLWNGKRFAKVGYLYQPDTGNYVPSLTEDKPALDPERARRGREPVTATLATIFDDRSVTAALRWSQSPDNPLASTDARFQDGLIQIVQFDGGDEDVPARLFTFSIEHGLRLTRSAFLPLDPNESPNVQYEVSDWRSIPGTPFTLPTRWITHRGIPTTGEASTRRKYTLDNFSFFDNDQSEAAFSVDESLLGKPVAEPATGPQLPYRATPSPAVDID